MALEFINTSEKSRRGGPQDLFATVDGVLIWLERAGLLDDEAGGAAGSSAVARVARDEGLRLRTALRELLRAGSAGTPPNAETVHTINRVLEGGARTSTLGVEGGHLVLRDVRHGASPLALLTPVALAAARLVTTVQPTRIRECAADDCTTWFIDTSKGGRRRWCSMARCGNRAKAARHRRRHADPT